MTGDELASLPSALAIKYILELLPASFMTKLAAIPMPKVPRPPRYDRKIFRKGGGFQWCSETSLEGLEFWQQRALDGVAKGGQYTENNQKDADQLQFWIDYRKVFPDTGVSTTRGDDNVTAMAPVDKPRIWTPLPKENPDDEYHNDSGENDPFPGA